MSLEKINEIKRKTKLAEQFLCAMIAAPKYWDVHSVNFKESVTMAFEMADDFIKKEKQLKEKL